jgi:hypothetical protein
VKQAVGDKLWIKAIEFRKPSVRCVLRNPDLEAIAGSDSGDSGENAAGEEGMIEDHDCAWFYWYPRLTLARWREECRLVEERFSLFRSFAEAPFFGFRGIVARSGVKYHVSVAAGMDMYPKYQPWVFVTPIILGAREDGKLSVDVSWSPETSRFADVFGAVTAHVERLDCTVGMQWG